MSDDQQNTTPRRSKRRWFQFSLRTLFVLIAACSGVFACLAAYVQPYWTEQRVIAKIHGPLSSWLI